MARPSIKRDGVGYLDSVPVHLFRIEVATGTAQRLTDGPGSEHDPPWASDGAWVLFRSSRTGATDLNQRTDLWMVSPDGGQGRRLTQGDVSAGAGSLSPGAAPVAFVSPLDPDVGYTPGRLMLASVAHATPVADFSQRGAGFESAGGGCRPWRRVRIR